MIESVGPAFNVSEDLKRLMDADDWLLTIEVARKVEGRNLRIGSDVMHQWVDHLRP
jgi:hypothetical protein